MEDLSYSCITCKKDYGTYKNLWAHNKSHHNGIKTVKVAFKTDEDDISFKCRKCNNVYKHSQSRHTHEKSCGGIVRTEIDLEYEKCRSINLDKEKENLVKEKENLELEIKLCCLRNEEMIEIQKIKEEEKQEKQEEKEERKEEKNRIEKEKRETQIKLRHLLLDLNQARIQSKFCR
jgi:uncharacterized Zn-finger protein